MKIIAKERGMGKTEHLINRSLETGHPIVCANEATKKLIMQRNKNVTVYTLNDIHSGKYVRGIDTVLVDELEYILMYALGLNVKEATFTGDISIETIENIPVKVNHEIKMKA